jgi:hypothetical protein
VFVVAGIDLPFFLSFPFLFPPLRIKLAHAHGHGRRKPNYFEQFIDVFVDFAATGGKRVWATPPSEALMRHRVLPPTFNPGSKRLNDILRVANTHNIHYLYVNLFTL